MTALERNDSAVRFSGGNINVLQQVSGSGQRENTGQIKQ